VREAEKRLLGWRWGDPSPVLWSPISPSELAGVRGRWLRRKTREALLRPSACHGVTHPKKRPHGSGGIEPHQQEGCAQPHGVTHVGRKVGPPREESYRDLNSKVGENG